MTVAVVTGAASGIGAACARRLAGDGLCVVVADIDGAGAEQVAASIVENGQGGEIGATAMYRQVYVSDPVSVARLVKGVVSVFGGLKIVVNSADIRGPSRPMARYPLDDFESVVRTNLGGVFHMMREALAVMESGGGGVIVNIASIAGTAAIRAHCAYVASKHGVIGLTKAAAREYAHLGIRVVSVSPGPIDTALTAALPPGVADRVAGSVPMGRLGHADEVAALVSLLVSDDARYISGSDHRIDGAALTQ
jgi:NAD(P)-dependent dehydrogenase (short-subunit alcohol dehydrogenase family)